MNSVTNEKHLHILKQVYSIASINWDNNPILTWKLKYFWVKFFLLISTLKVSVGGLQQKKSFSAQSSENIIGAEEELLLIAGRNQNVTKWLLKLPFIVLGCKMKSFLSLFRFYDYNLVKFLLKKSTFISSHTILSMKLWHQL